MLNAETPGRVMLTTDSVGGVWRYCLELSRGFLERGAKVTLVQMGPHATDMQVAEVRRCGVELVETGLPLDWLANDEVEVASATRKLASIAQRLRADTVQLHTPAFAAGAVWPAPVVAMAHSCVGTWWRAVHGNVPLPSDLAWRADCIARGLASADAMVAPSSAFADALRQVYGEGHTAIVAIPNGRKTTPLPRAPRQQAFTAGRLWDEGKNIRVLDAAAAALEYPVRAAGPVRGPNGAHTACRHLQLLGSLDDTRLAQEYAQAAVFVSPARYEPFGLAVLEAAQAGVALLLADIPSFRELWDGAAVFVHPDDPAELSLTLRRLLSDQHCCTALGQAARTRSSQYSAEQMIATTWNVHCNLWRRRTAMRARCAA